MSNKDKEIKDLKAEVRETRESMKELRNSIQGIAGIFNSKCYMCGAKCCRYIVVKLNDPEDVEDIEELRWFVCHKNILLCIDDDQWELVVLTDCQNLDAFGRCRIYEKRPDLCREHSEEDCEFSEPGEWGESIFRSLEELDDYLRDNYKWWWKKKKGERKRK